VWREVVIFDPWPHVLPMNALLNLMQRFGWEHSVEVNVVAEVREKSILALGL